MRSFAVLFALCVLGSAAPLEAAIQAGVAAAVRGEVTIQSAEEVGRVVQSGAAIYLGDSITTGDASGLQVLLLDETVFTLGPNSELVIDEFVYDPGAEDGKLNAELVRGAFRFISGQIAKDDPESMKVKLPSGTIGIRGTVVDTSVDPATGRSLVVLAAPGRPDLDVGAIEVVNAGIARDVRRGGWGVEIPNFSDPPSAPFLVPAEMYSSFDFQVGGPATRGGGDSQSNGSGAPSASTKTPRDSKGTESRSRAQDGSSEPTGPRPQRGPRAEGPGRGPEGRSPRDASETPPRRNPGMAVDPRTRVGPEGPRGANGAPSPPNGPFPPNGPPPPGAPREGFRPEGGPPGPYPGPYPEAGPYPGEGPASEFDPDTGFHPEGEPGTFDPEQGPYPGEEPGAYTSDPGTYEPGEFGSPEGEFAFDPEGNLLSPTLEPLDPAFASFDPAFAEFDPAFAEFDSLDSEFLVFDPNDPSFFEFDPNDPDFVAEADEMITQINDLVELSMTFEGTFFYDAFEIPLVSSTQSALDLFVDLDFALDEVRVSLVDVASSILELTGDGFGRATVPFSAAPGPDANFILRVPYSESSCMDPSCVHPASVSLTFGTKAGVVAAGVAAEVTIRNPEATLQDTSVPVLIPRTGESGTISSP